MRSKWLLMLLVIALLSVVVAVPASAQGSTWYAEYYNNPTLSGSPAITRFENGVALNWGVGSPGAGVNSDGFSARVATDVTFTPGTYRFFLLADDNARVTFNFNQVVLDTFTNPSVGQLRTADLTVPQAGVYHIQIDYREVDSTAFLYFSFGNAAANPQPNFPANPGIPGAISGTPIPLTSPWTAQYYANNSLGGDPAAILTVPTVTFNYGTAAPLGSVPADNWSARFTSVQNLQAGTYTLQVNADDGVRVFVNGGLVINQFGGATGQTYSAQLNLPSGGNNFQVEYQEFSGNSFLNFALTIPSAPAQPAPQIPTSPTGATATVTAFRLNVRAFPDPLSQRLATINRNEVYGVLGRNAAGTWYLLNLGNGIQGWSSAIYLNVQNGFNVPVVNTQGTGGQPTAVPTTAPGANTGIIVIANPYTVNIRSGPSTTSPRIARLPNGATAALIGRNSLNQWWQINYNGIVGWVTATYTQLSPANPNLNSVPVTG